MAKDTTSHSIKVAHIGGTTTFYFETPAQQRAAYVCMTNGSSGIFRHTEGETHLLPSGVLLTSSGVLEPVAAADSESYPRPENLDATGRVRPTSLSHESSAPVKVGGVGPLGVK